jgi:pectin methylesterase-like acyl-CoA thioesterase
LRNVHILTPGDYVLAGLDAQHELGATLDNVFTDALSASHVQSEHANITMGVALGNLVPEGTNVTVGRASGSRPGSPLACGARFVPFPSLKTAPQLAVAVPPEDKALYVAADGTGDYYSIQRAIDVAPPSGAVISVAPGTYHEVLTINKPNLVLRGPYEDATKTVVVAGKSAGTDGGTFARQYFGRCFIEGNVDFIFGDGKTVFDHCVIRNNPHSVGFVTAQGKSYVSQDSGFVFRDCRIEAEPNVENVYLGRPWRPYSTVIYLNTWMGAHILPEGWREWHPGETDYLPTALYAEYESSGPGANPSQRQPHAIHLTEQQAATYAPEKYLRGGDGWNPRAVLEHERALLDERFGRETAPIAARTP